MRSRGGRHAVRAVGDDPGNRLGAEPPRLGGRAVRLVEPHDVALARLAVAVVENEARGRRDGIAPRAFRKTPELLLGPVRLVEHGSGAAAAAGFGEELSARRDSVEPRGGIALEGERARGAGQRAAGFPGGDAHVRSRGGRHAVRAVGDDHCYCCPFVFRFKVIACTPFAIGFLGYFRSRG